MCQISLKNSKFRAVYIEGNGSKCLLAEDRGVIRSSDVYKYISSIVLDSV